MTLSEQSSEKPGPKQLVNGSDDSSGKLTSSNRLGFPMRLIGSGMELASYTLLLGAAGYWLDSRWQLDQHYFAIAGALAGFSLGMYRLIVLATRQG